MNRLKSLFEKKPKSILNIFLTAGYPNLDDMPNIVKILTESGVDMVEIGMPYSDPLADGETIQYASSIALKNGMSLDLLFEQLRELRAQVDIPIILMGYFNQVLQYGTERFIAACKQAGVDGLILPDLPLFEYERTYAALFKAADLQVSLLVCPSTSPDRIRKIDAISTGFIYLVADAATTGRSDNLRQDQIQYFERIQGMELKSPKLIGFGISDHEAFVQASKYSNGAIIGSAFLRSIAGLKDDQLQSAAKGFVESII